MSDDSPIAAGLPGPARLSRMNRTLQRLGRAPRAAGDPWPAVTGTCRLRGEDTWEAGHLPQGAPADRPARPGSVIASLAWLLAVLLLLGAGLRVAWFTWAAGMPVTVTVDGYREELRTTRPDVAGVLADLGLSLRPQDRVSPALSTSVTGGSAIFVQRARRGLVSADGSLFEVYSQSRTVGELLAAARLQPDLHDELTLDGAPASAGSALPAPVTPAGPPRFARPRAWLASDPQPVRISLRRAVRIVVDDGSVPYAIFSTAPTVGEALLREQVTLYLGDQVRPSLGSSLQAGIRVTIERSKPVLVSADGHTVRTRTRGKSVGDTLAELGITVAGSDRVTPAMPESITDNVAIRIVRVQNLVQVERRSIPYELVVIPDDNLEIDHQQLTQAGADGEFRRRYRSTIEDGVEVTRTLIDAWVAAQPVTNVVSYGRKVVMRTLDTQEGQISYWRHIRMYATSYSKSTAGVSPSASYFGITRLGLPMRRGIVAVDPTVVILGSKVYVPGYGTGLAGDTGGGVRGKWVDLGYDDDNLVAWHQWVDVYLLGDPPPSGWIRWVLPNWPQLK